MILQEAGKESSVQEELWLEGAQCNDPKALAGIFDAFHDRLYGYIYRRTRQPGLSEDLAGEVFLRLLEALQAGRGPRKNLQAWLFRVAHNLIIDHYRRDSKAVHQPLEDWSVLISLNPTENVEQELLLAQLRKAISRLTSDQQQVIYLKFVEGMTNSEVGQILDKPEGAVKSLQHRALAAIRRQIDDGEVQLSLSDLSSGIGSQVSETRL